MHTDVQKVVDKLMHDGEAIEFTPSKEVLRLYKYNIVQSKMGALWDQAFTPMVFAEGDARQLSAYMMFSQIRMCENDLFTLDHMKAMFRDTVPLSAEFLSTVGFEELWENTKEVLAVLDLIDNKANYRKMLDAYCFYATNLHNWIHFFFPWYCGEFFTMRKKEEIAELTEMFNM